MDGRTDRQMDVCKCNGNFRASGEGPNRGVSEGGQLSSDESFIGVFGEFCNVEGYGAYGDMGLNGGRFVQLDGVVSV